SACKVGVAAIDGKAPTAWIDVEGDPRNHYIARMDWAPSSGKKEQTVIFQRLNRLQNTNVLMRAQTYDWLHQTIGEAGGPKRVFKMEQLETLFTETDKAWVDLH